MRRRPREARHPDIEARLRDGWTQIAIAMHLRTSLNSVAAVARRLRGPGEEKDDGASEPLEA